MKKNRLAAAGFALAIAAGSLVAAPAFAADVYVPGDITAVEAGSYPAGWFTGSDPVAAATPTGSDAGLQITGRTILLNGESTTITGGAHLRALMESADIDADGAATFQIPIFFNSTGEAKQFATIRPTNPGTPGTTWVLSRSVEQLMGNTPYTAAEIEEATDNMIADSDGTWVPQVLAFGVIVDEGTSVLLRSVSFDGDNYLFTKEPVVDVPTEETPDAQVPTPVVKKATFTG